MMPCAVSLLLVHHHLKREIRGKLSLQDADLQLVIAVEDAVLGSWAGPGRCSSVPSSNNH